MNAHHPSQRTLDFVGGLPNRDFHRHADGLGKIFERDDNLGDNCPFVVAFGDVEIEARVLADDLNASDAFAEHVLHWHRLEKNRIAHTVVPHSNGGQNMHRALELGNGFRFRSAFRNSALNEPVATIGAVDGRYAERSAARDAGGNIASRTMRYGTPRNLNSPSLSPTPRDHSQQAAEQAVSQSISKPAEAIHA